MIGSIIAAIISIAATVTTNAVQNNQNEIAQDEARGIANRNRSSALKQQSFENRVARKNLKMQQESFNLDKQQTEYNMAEQQKEAERQVNMSNKSFLDKTASNILGNKNQEESFLYKRSLLNRIK